MLQLALRTAAWFLIAALASPAGIEAQRTLLATKPSERETVLTRRFAAPPQAVFDVLTKPQHLLQWMKTSSMSLVACDVDFKAGGSFR